MSKPYEIVALAEPRSEWLEARRGGIGASDTPKILGLSPYGGALTVAADKKGLLPDEDNEILAAGRRLEPVIAEWALEDMGHKSGHPWGFLIRSVEHPHLMATPDWVILEEGDIMCPLQIKNTMMASDWDEGVPSHVKVQVLQEIIVMGAPHGYVAVLLTGNRLRWAKVERDPELEAQILETTLDFWRDCQKDEADFAERWVDGDKATRGALVLLHPDDNGETKALGVFLMEEARDLEEKKAEIKVLEKQRREHENTLIAALGPATFGTFPDGSGVSFKTTERKAYPVKATKFRQLRIAKAKK